MKYRKRNKRNGRFRKNYFIQFFPIVLLLLSVGASLYFKSMQEIEQEFVSPLPVRAYTEQAVEPETVLFTPSPTPTPIITEKTEILSYIVEVFGDDSVDAIQIAKCESRFQKELVGDKHLMTVNDETGEEIGDSIGIFQIRTGDKDWNRAKANGMSVNEFREKLKDYRYNVEYAKEIFDKNSGWNPWFNCMNKELLNK